MTKKEHTLSRRGLITASLSAMVAGASSSIAQAAGIKSDVDAQALPAGKTTPLGLYLTSTAAHDALTAEPEILFVDVRDPIEITFVGHPKGLDKIVPLRVITHQVDPNSGQYAAATNPNVVAEFNTLFRAKGKSKSDPLFVTCRSGSRSAVAVRLLVEAGYKNVWNLIEGFEGDRDENGVRSRNGWRNAGLPWSYKLEKGVAWNS